MDAGGWIGCSVSRAKKRSPMLANPWTRLMLASLLAALVAFPYASVHANPPTIVTIPVDDTLTFPAGTLCSFAVVRHIEGFVRITSVDGNLAQVQQHLHGSFANPQTGKALDFVVAAND